MKSNYDNKRKNGYLSSIRKGIEASRMLGRGLTAGQGTLEERLVRLYKALNEADAILVGAGAGLSTAAGLTYDGERFERYFRDFKEAYGITDMYSGGFYPFPDEETYWAWWSRHIYFNRYIDAPKPVYKDLLRMLEGKNYFVITTNVDHQFIRAGFDKRRLFYTQGDYGLFQEMDPTAPVTFDNEEWVMEAMRAQGFVMNEAGIYELPEVGYPKMSIPTELIPSAPTNGARVIPNLRADDSFVEDDGWYGASAAYADFLGECEGKKVLYLEIGVGMNTPVIIKYPFWQMTHDNEKAEYCCLNFSEAYCPASIEDRSICIGGDSSLVIKTMLGETE